MSSTRKFLPHLRPPRPSRRRADGGRRGDAAGSVATRRGLDDEPVRGVSARRRRDQLPRQRGGALDRGQPDQSGQPHRRLPAGPLLERRRQGDGRRGHLQRGRDLDAGRVPTESRCTGGPFQRTSDPWVTFGPDGTAHSMSLVTDPDPPTGGFGDNGMVYSRSTTGGLTWDDPILLVTETDPRFLHDKNSMTADPNDADFVYAVWDRSACGPRGRPEPENPIGPASRDRSTSRARRTAATPGSPLARSTRPAPTRRRSETRSSFVRRDRCLTSLSTRKQLEPPRRSRPDLLSYIVSADRGETWSHPVSIDDQLPMTLFRESSTVDLEPVPARIPPRPEPVRSAAATSSRMWRSTRPTGSCTPCGWTPASASSRPAPSGGTASRTASRPTAGRRGRRPSRSTRLRRGAIRTPRRSRLRSRSEVTARSR